LLIDHKDESKALAIYNRFLRSIPAQQAPERVARYAFLLQRQNRADEAVEQYNKAGELFVAAGRDDDALFCWERIARLEPDNLARQIKLAEGAERLGKNALAARAFLRAGQLATTKGSSSDAVNLLGRAQKLAPQERSVALLYAQANLQKCRGEHEELLKRLDHAARQSKDESALRLIEDLETMPADAMQSLHAARRCLLAAAFLGHCIAAHNHPPRAAVAPHEHKRLN